MNTDEPDVALFKAERRVLEIQAKLHQWAIDRPLGLVESPLR